MLRTAHDLLVYLVDLSDSERSGVLVAGQYLINEAKKDGLIEWNDADLDQFGRFLFALKDDGSLTFRDRSEGSRLPHAPIRFDDVNQAEDIRVTGPGRVAAQASRPSMTIGQLAIGGNISNIDLTVLISAIERQIEEGPGNEEEKAEARTRLGKLKETAENVGTGAAGDLIASALRQVLGGLG